MKTGRTPILVASTILLVGAIAGAQPAKQAPIPGYGWGAGRGFDPDTIETIQGEIIDITSVPSASGRGTRGVHLNVGTGSGPVAVHIGPEWYLRRQGVTLSAGEEVTITGSRVSLNGEPALVAMELRRGDGVLRLRCPNGIPAWGGWGGRGWGRGRGANPGWGVRGGRGWVTGPGSGRAGRLPPER